MTWNIYDIFSVLAGAILVAFAVLPWTRSQDRPWSASTGTIFIAYGLYTAWQTNGVQRLPETVLIIPPLGIGYLVYSLFTRARQPIGEVAPDGNAEPGPEQSTPVSVAQAPPRQSPGRTWRSYLAWEGALLILVITALLDLNAHSKNLSYAGLELGIAVQILIVTGMAISFRAGAPNFAVIGVGLFSAELCVLLVGASGWSVPVGIVAALAGGALLSVAVAAICAMTGAPTWATSIGCGLAAEALALAIIPVGDRISPATTADQAFLPLAMLLQHHPLRWCVGVAVFCVGVGSAFRSATVYRWFHYDPSVAVSLPSRFRRQVPAFVASGVLAGLGMLSSVIVFNLYFRPDSAILFSGYLSSNTSFDYVLLAFGTVLLGGTGLRGGGGFAGTALASALVVTMSTVLLSRISAFRSEGYPYWSLPVLLFAAPIIVGLAVSERLARGR
jgi:hypothetical protein